MQVVILAGGLGTRLRPATTRVPKPMVQVAGVPYLEHQLRLLADQGLRDVVLLTAYLGEQIEAHFGDGTRLGLSIRYSREPQPLGTGGALRFGSRLLADSFLVLYGDSYLPIEYAAVGRRLEESGAMAVVVLYHDHRGDTGVRANVSVDESGFVIRYDKAAAGGGLRYIDAGVLALRRSVVSLIPEGTVSLEQQIFPLLIRERALAGLFTAQCFYDIGTPERLKRIEQLLA